MAKDPVCGMQVDEQRSISKGLTSEYSGQTYYFCSPGCKRQFEQSPERFAGQSSSRASESRG